MKKPSGETSNVFEKIFLSDQLFVEVIGKKITFKNIFRKNTLKCNILQLDVKLVKIVWKIYLGVFKLLSEIQLTCEMSYYGIMVFYK